MTYPWPYRVEIVWTELRNMASVGFGYLRGRTWVSFFPSTKWHKETKWKTGIQILERANPTSRPLGQR